MDYDSDDDCESEVFYKECPKIKRIMNPSDSQNNMIQDNYSGTNYIFPQDLDKYLDMGFCHFKIQGRELTTSQMFGEFCPYLIKPEFYQMAMSIIGDK